jgi:aryl-alcohol dehydrogenase-like predicted oxidoreductase
MIEYAPIGNGGLKASLLALGCMGMSEFYVGSTEHESAATIATAVEQGVTMFDTADMYGPFTNERFVGRCLRAHRANIILATKFGYVRRPDGTRLGLNGRPEYVRQACDASLARLGTNYIDLYYLHRVDRSVPIEDTIGAMGDLVRAGKVRFIGLSEVSPKTVRRAHRVFPVTAVQSEYSLVSREPEQDLFDTLDALGIGFIAYAPLGRGLLTGRFGSYADIPEADYRRTSPRFLPENLPHNVRLLETLAFLARKHCVTSAQLALMWAASHVANRGVVLVGTTHRSRLLENIRSIKMQIDPECRRLLDEAYPLRAALGSRYPDMSRVNA